MAALAPAKARDGDGDGDRDSGGPVAVVPPSLSLCEGWGCSCQGFSDRFHVRQPLTVWIISPAFLSSITYKGRQSLFFKIFSVALPPHTRRETRSVPNAQAGRVLGGAGWCL